MPPNEQRKHPRRRARGLACHYRVGDTLALGLLVENISLGGVFIRTEDPLPVGTPLMMEVARPGSGQAIKVSGRVANAISHEQGARRAIAPGMGIRFDPFHPEIGGRLERLIASLPPSTAEPPHADLNPVEVDPSLRDAFDFDFGSHEGPEPAEPTAQPIPLVRDVPAHGSSSPPFAGAESARLMVQVKGLLLELGELQAQLDGRGREISALKAEVSWLRTALGNALQAAEKAKAPPSSTLNQRDWSEEVGPGA